MGNGTLILQNVCATFQVSVAEVLLFGHIFQVYSCATFDVENSVVTEFLNAPVTTIPEVLLSPKKRRLSVSGVASSVSSNSFRY